MQGSRVQPQDQEGPGEGQEQEGFHMPSYVIWAFFYKQRAITTITGQQQEDTF